MSKKYITRTAGLPCVFLLFGLAACTPVKQTLPNGAIMEGYQSPLFGSSLEVTGADSNVLHAKQLDALKQNPDPQAAAFAQDIQSVGRLINPRVDDRATLEEARARARKLAMIKTATP